MKLFSQNELATWQTRSISGPGLVKGDLFTNSPAEWIRITNSRNNFTSNPTQARWSGLPYTGAAVINNSGVEGVDVPNKSLVVIMQEAAFYALVKNDSIIKRQIITELLWHASQSKLDFTNRSIWPIGVVRDNSPYFEMGIWGCMLLYTYDYIEDVATPSEKTTIMNWFKGFSDFLRDEVNGDLNSLWENRSIDNPIENYKYKGPTTLSSEKCVSGGSEIINGVEVPLNGFQTIAVHRFYNNRRAHMACQVGLYGAKTGSRTHVDCAKNFVREMLACAIDPNGIIVENLRSETSLPSKGLNYFNTTLSTCLIIADALARIGDFSMYNHKSKFGVGATNGNVDKSLLWSMLEFGKYLNGKKKIYSKEGVIGDENFRIDGTSPNWIMLNHITQFGVANMFFKNSEITSMLTGDVTKGYYSIPTSGEASNGTLQWYQSLAGNGPAVFKYSGMQSVNPYDLSVPALPDAPSSISTSNVTINSFTANWTIVSSATSYKLDVATDSTFNTFVAGYNNLTVNSISQNVTGLINGVNYYYRVRAVNGNGTSTNSPIGTVVTTSSHPIEDPLYPNLVIRKEFEGNFTKVVDTDNDVAELTNTGLSGGKEVRLYDIGDKISIALDLPPNEYTVKVMARSGSVSSMTNYGNSYRFSINGKITTARLETASIGVVNPTLGGSYFGFFVLDKFISTKGITLLEIEALTGFSILDYLEVYKTPTPSPLKYSIDQLATMAGITATTPQQLFDGVKNLTLDSVIDELKFKIKSPFQITFDGATGATPPTEPPVMLNNTFTFELTDTYTTSAGVYRNDGVDDILVRSLWNAEQLEAGTYSRSWDGYVDSPDTLKTLSVDGDYFVKIVRHNIKYIWNGARIGNNSEDATGENKWRQYSRLHNIVFPTESRGFYCSRYSEGSPNYGYFESSNTKKRYKFLKSPLPSTDQETYLIATDGTRLYFAGKDPFFKSAPGQPVVYGSKYFVFAINVSALTEYTFSSGSSLQMAVGRLYNSVISVTDGEDSLITGLAVQRTGNFLVLTRTSRNEIEVRNKLTGALIKINNFTSPKTIAFDNSDNLWMIYENSANKFTVASDGSVTSSGTAITGFSDPLAISTSTDGVIVTVIDGGTSQQVKAYNTSTRASVWVLGRPGYTVSAKVYEDKFLFIDTKGFKNTYITHLSDGSFWLGDQGNLRNLHFNSSRQVIDQICYVEHVYSSSTDGNNPSRVFSNYLEFERDYSVTLTGTTGYKLVNNWGGKIPAGVTDTESSRLQFVNTLMNGRTYCFQKNGINWVMLELVNDGLLRNTGLVFSVHCQLYPDGTVRRVSGMNDGSPVIFYSRSISGFDNNGNPVYKPEVEIDRSPNLLASDPRYQGDETKFSAAPITSDGKVLSWNGARFPVGVKGYHLGALKKGKWLWKTAIGTSREWYSGDFPNDGFFDEGNMLQYAGTKCMVIENNIVWGHHGEFWKNNQTNKYTHLLSNGLTLKVFGYTGKDFEGEAGFGFAGNAFSPSMVKVGNKIYIHSNDEGRHAAIHEWQIEGLETIIEENIPIKLENSNIVKIPSNSTDLLEGLDHGNITLVNNKGGWIRTQPVNVLTDPLRNFFTVITGQKSYDKFKSPDINVIYRQNTVSNESIFKALPVTQNLSSWKLNTKISFENAFGNVGTFGQSLSGGQFLEILDNSDKIISRFYFNVSASGLNPNIIGNGVSIVSGVLEDLRPVLFKFQSLELSSEGSGIKFTYGDYNSINAPLVDSTANKFHPKILRLYFWYNGSNNARQVSLKDCFFTKG